LLRKGKVVEAALLLGYPYTLTGQVVDGHKIGRTLGFPTANIRPNGQKLIPADGVYIVQADVLGATYGGMLSIGKRPTFHADDKRTIEVYLFNFYADIYDRIITIRFLHYIRPEKKFARKEQLIEEMERDLSISMRYFQENPK
jgi:riboflavin kinase/FMN adenylyltransferase